jgi:hypothetical protein
MTHQGIDALVRELRSIAGDDCVLTDAYSLGLYNHDGGDVNLERQTQREALRRVDRSMH